MADKRCNFQSTRTLRGEVSPGVGVSWKLLGPESGGIDATNCPKKVGQSGGELWGRLIVESSCLTSRLESKMCALIHAVDRMQSLNCTISSVCGMYPWILSEICNGTVPRVPT